MNFFEDQKYWEQYVDDHGGNIYESVVSIARDATGLERGVHHLISHSDAISWALTDIPPKDLKKRLRIRESRRKHLVRDIDEWLSQIDDIEIREAVDSSCRLSIINKQLTYDYGQIIDSNIRARVRILTRMILKDKPFKEEIQMENDNMIVPKLEVEDSANQTAEPKKRRGRPPKAETEAKKETEVKSDVAEEKEEPKKENEEPKATEDKKEEPKKEEKKVEPKKEEPKEAKKSEPTKEEKKAEPKKDDKADDKAEDKAEKKPAKTTKKPAKKASKKKSKKDDDTSKLKAEIAAAKTGNKKHPVLDAPDPDTPDEDSKESHIGQLVLIPSPLIVYRGPDRKAPMKAFAGYVTILSNVNDEFVKVQFTRPGVGVQIGFMILPDNIKNNL